MSGFGRHTGADLGDLRWWDDAVREGPGPHGARIALELAQFSYDMQAGPWLEAGWTDISFQVDNHLLTGVRGAEEDRDWRQQILNAVMPRLARGLMVVSNPFTEARSALRHEFSHGTGKAVTMILPAGDGSFTVAVGFMGTGRRPQDWAGNMRFAHTDGLHGGFEAIAEQFEQNADSIRFPAAARALGRERLFSEVLRMPTAGQPLPHPAGRHSRAAVMQAWILRRRRACLPGSASAGLRSPMAAAGLARPAGLSLSPLPVLMTSSLAWPAPAPGTVLLLRADGDPRAPPREAMETRCPGGFWGC